MDETIDIINSHLNGAETPTKSKGLTMVYVSVAAVIGFIVIQLTLSWVYANKKLIWTFMVTFVSVPIKFITFLLLGQAPLRYSGYLDDFPVKDIIKLAYIGGIMLVIPYILIEQRYPTPEPKPLTQEEEYNRKRQPIKLDRALQEKLTILLLREINHTLVADIIGISIMRFVYGHPINIQQLDLLISTALFGPTLFFALFLLSSGVLLCVRWTFQAFRDWWHGWGS